MNFNITKQWGTIATHLESPWALPALMEHTDKTKALTAINENTGWIKIFYKVLCSEFQDVGIHVKRYT